MPVKTYVLQTPGARTFTFARAGTATVDCFGGAGSGAGAFSRKNSVSIVAGVAVNYQVGAGILGGTTQGGAGGVLGDTIFNGTTLANGSCSAEGGAKVAAGNAGLAA